jgi:hypothetical protein
VQSFFWRWFRRLPTPFRPDDLKAGYVYELAFRQFEISDTRVFDRPQAGRAFFEGLIRDHLDVGRPQQVVLVFDRRLMPNTPGRFSTKVITRGVDPQVSCTYKSTRQKQYFKEGPCPPHRDHDLEHPRLRDRPARQRRELASPAGRWPSGQPASLRRPSSGRQAGPRCGHRAPRDPAVEDH